ncbi:MAG: hypothetical protein ACRDGH_08025, partial [Candidatus Limnocylindria bacterium]
MPQASNGAQPTGHVARLVDLLAAHPDGLTGAQVRSSSAFSAVPAARLAALIGSALALGHVIETAGRLHAVNAAAASAAEPADAEPLTTVHALRAVVLDVESIVKTTSKEPFTDKQVYQIGAVRAGTDSAWIAAEPTFTRWLELPDDSWVIFSEGTGAEQQEVILERRRGGIDESAPPYRVTRVDVESVVSDPHLRTDITSAFRDTLNLDARYNVIANVLAHNAHENGMDDRLN